MELLSHYLKSHEKRKIVLDESTVLIAVSRCIQDQFGAQGMCNIKAVSWNNGTVILEIQKSIWAGEFLQQKKTFLECCNNYFQSEQPIKKIFVRS
ncbi:MAG: hypothetical protein IPN70_02660 [Candidatus Moraniibacteriota bacterium]|nr:MAG: hypothetical protein IPN70_02660 [Candidatus Moranbacteria bacterium]